MSGIGLAIFSFIITVTLCIVWFRLLTAVKIPKNRSIYILLFILSLCMGIASLAIGTENILASIGAGLAILVSTLYLLTVAIGNQKGGTGKFVVGKPLPVFSAVDENNISFDITTLSGQPILLKFFRGHW